MERRKKDIWQIISENWIWFVTMIFLLGTLYATYNNYAIRIDNIDKEIATLEDDSKLILSISAKVDYVISDLSEIRSDIRAIRSSEKLSDIPIRPISTEIAGVNVQR